MLKIASLLLVSALVWNTTSSANELGDKMLVIEPKAKPVFVDKSGTRYWRCNDMVGANLLVAVFNDLKFMSEQNGLPVPQQNLCLYNIGNLKVGNNSITLHSVDFYTNQKSMEMCLSQNYCGDFRTMNFHTKDGEVFRSYMVTSAAKKLSKGACTKLDGTVISATQGCEVLEKSR